MKAIFWQQTACEVKLEISHKLEYSIPEKCGSWKFLIVDNHPNKHVELCWWNIIIELKEEKSEDSLRIVCVIPNKW